MRVVFFIMIMALVTYALRFLPIAVMRRPIQTPFVRLFLYYVPFSVLSAMVFPAVFYATGNTAAAFLGTMMAIALALAERPMIFVIVCSVFVTYLGIRLL